MVYSEARRVRFKTVVGSRDHVTEGFDLEDENLFHPSNIPSICMKKIGFLSFGHWSPSSQSETRSAQDVLLQSIDLAIVWSPGSGTLDPALVSGFDTVVHLAGEPVVGLWSSAKKRRIMESRVLGTAELATALAAATRPPRLFLSASGINFYGNRGDTVLDETAPSGQGFLAEVCKAWEAASNH
jgi:hypothetical protein